ncbi:hypothetical protein KM043_000182 [Ampulex compressa]|nr:hypothetical protein KM043_000182 [Ampulex compressa]
MNPPISLKSTTIRIRYVGISFVRQIQPYTASPCTAFARRSLAGFDGEENGRSIAVEAVPTRCSSAIAEARARNPRLGDTRGVRDVRREARSAREGRATLERQRRAGESEERSAKKELGPGIGRRGEGRRGEIGPRCADDVP